MNWFGNKAGAGFTFVETAVAMALLMVIFLGSVQYIQVSRSSIAAAAHALKAWQTITNRFEYALALDYSSLTDSLAESGTLLAWDDLKSYRTTVVENVDDPVDGSSPADTVLPDYLKLTVKIARFSATNFTDSSSIYITPQRGW